MALNTTGKKYMKCQNLANMQDAKQGVTMTAYYVDGTWVCPNPDLSRLVDYFNEQRRNGTIKIMVTKMISNEDFNNMKNWDS